MSPPDATARAKADRRARLKVKALEREQKRWFQQQEQFERDNPDDDLGLLIDPWGL